MAIQLRPVRTPIAIQREYHKKLKAFVKEMDKSLYWWLRASYRQVDKDIIQTTAKDGAMGNLVKELRRLEREWIKKSNIFATQTAKWFSGKIQGYTTITIQNEMKKRDLVKLGFNLEHKYHSAKERAIYKSIVNQNVNLIKSIASEHLTKVHYIFLWILFFLAFHRHSYNIHHYQLYRLYCQKHISHDINYRFFYTR